MGKFALRIILYKCEDLLASDITIAGGKSDPYVIFNVRNKNKKSSTIMDDLNPQWSPPEKFEFELDEWEHEFIQIDVYDYDRFSRDDLIGQAIVPLGLFSGGRHNEMYSYPLVLPEEEGAEGLKSNIFLQISLTTKSGQPVS